MKTIRIEPQQNVARGNESKVADSLCRTFLFFTRLSGLFVGNNVRLQPKRHGFKIFLEFFVSLISTVFLLGYTILLTTNFWKSEDLDKRTLLRCIAFQMRTFGTVVFSIVMSYRLPKVLPHFVDDLKSYEEEFSFCPGVVSCARRMARIKFLLAGLFLFPGVALSYVMLEYISMRQIYFPTYGFNQFWYTFTVVCVVISQVITMVQLCTSLFFYITISYCALAEFQLLSSRMEKSIKGITAELETSLEFVYHKHEAVCGLVDSANECFKPYLVLTLAGYIPVSCLVLYALIIEDITSIDAAILSCLMILSSMIAIFVILFAGGLVSSKADEMTGHLWKIKPAALSERGLQALSIFVTKLCHQSTGFSVYGLFTINMPAIITIFGSIFAYFVVIIQFKSAESSVCPVNNCTMLP